MIIDDSLVPPDEGPAASAAWSADMLHMRLLEVAAAGALAALLLVLFWLKLRPDVWAAMGHPFFWIKGLYTVTLAAIALAGASTAARRGVLSWPALAAGGGVVALMVLAAALEAPALGAAMRAQILNPAAAMGCGLFIALLAAPMLLAAGVGLRGVDLERPGLTGLFIGLFCGAVAASIYGLHCGHATFLYVALWYSLGIALCGVVGAAGMKLTRRRLQTEPLHLHC